MAFSKRLFRLAALGCAVALIASPALAGEEWFRFRGPNGSGISTATGLPVELGPGTNVAWASAVPFGRSSPALGGNRAYLTGIENGKLVVLAFDRDSGEEVWRRDLDRRFESDLYYDNDAATPSPVTDGKNVYVFFSELGIVSFDPKGRERWRLPLGPFRNFYGLSASPVLAGDLLLVLCDQAEDSFLLAVDAATGKIRWRRDRPLRRESYTTPILYPSAETPKQALVFGSRWLDAYDLRTGELAWSVGNVSTAPVSSPVLVGKKIFVNGPAHADQPPPSFAEISKGRDADGDGRLSRKEVEGFWLAKHFGWVDADGDKQISSADWDVIRGEMLPDSWGLFAIDLGRRGEDGRPSVVWNHRKNIPTISSPLVYRGIVYLADDGVLTTLDADTGEVAKRDRLGAGLKVYASPVAADGKIYIAALDGKVVVLEAGADWKVVATSELGEAIHATPVPVDDGLFIRTKSKLYKFAVAEKPVPGKVPEGSR